MSKNNVQERLQAFVENHPEGWDHTGWLGLLSDLQQAGVDVSDPQDIGRSLERTRLAATLRAKKVQGLGPKRIQAVVEHFGTLWNLQHASADEIAEIPTIPARLAKTVRQAMN